MGGINYFRTVPFNVAIINAWKDQDSLISSAQKNTTGAPDADAGYYVVGALIQNVVSGIIYRNAGTTAAPVWEDIQSGLSLPFADTDGTSTTGASFAITSSALTTGAVYRGTGSGATLTTGGIFDAALGVAVTGYGFRAVTTGVYTGTAGILQITANSATTGTLSVFSGTGLTTGILQKAVAAAGTLTTGRYYSANDGALEVFGIGANGHIHTQQTTAPTIAVSQASGITAAAITAGATDTCGIITTTGTNNGAADTILVVTFGKTYTTAPKTVQLTALNQSGAKVSAGTAAGTYISAVSATTFTITIPRDASATATPSWSYIVIA
jgi:hypothetical protein